MEHEGQGEDTCSCKLSDETMSAFRSMQDAVFDAQERMKDGDYKVIMESMKHVFDACMNDKHKFDYHRARHREARANLKFMVIEGVIGWIVRDEEWEGMTMEWMRNKIKEVSNARTIPMNDETLKEVMKKHILQVKKRDRKRKRAEESTNREDEEHTLFPILRR